MGDGGIRPAGQDEGLPSLVADIGGTNARFGVLIGDQIVAHETLACADFSGPAAAAAHFLGRQGTTRNPRQAALAIAGPVASDQIAITNNPWRFSVAETKAALGLDRLVVINDFTAVALSAPRLGAIDLQPIGGGAPEVGAPIAVLGPGTGLGVSAVIPVGTAFTAIAGEGGHVTMAPTDELESRVLGYLREEVGHVSAERLLSGMGLVNLTRALAAVTNRTPAVALRPDAISEAARTGSCLVSRGALTLFCSMLGTVAGNLALTLGARGGVHLAGGILPRFADFLVASPFRERFVSKGRLRPYLEPIPTSLITHPLPAFLGLAERLRQL